MTTAMTEITDRRTRQTDMTTGLNDAIKPSFFRRPKWENFMVESKEDFFNEGKSKEFFFQSRTINETMQIKALHLSSHD